MSKKSIFIVFIVSILLSISILLLVGKQSNETTVYQNWKKTYVKPYVESLDDTSYEVQKVEEVVTSLFSNFKEEVGVKIFSNNPDVEKIYRVTYLKNGYPYTHTGLTSLRFVDGDKKEITGKYVEKDLGRDLKKGFYKAEIYMPKDYKIEKISEEVIEK